MIQRQYLVYKRAFVNFFLALIVLGFCSCSALLESTVSPTIDEITGFKSPPDSLDLKNMTLSWRVTENTLLEVKVSAPTTGWIGVGFAPLSSTKMSDANIVMAYVDSAGNTKFSDEFGTGPNSITTDLTNDVTVISGAEAAGNTALHFTLPLDSEDSSDIVLKEGEPIRILLAYGTTDDFTTKHSSLTRTSFSVDPL